MNLRHARFEIVCELTASGNFPPYKGSMLRGAFGHSLRRTVCTMGKVGRTGQHTECDHCLLRNTCPFPQLFVGKAVTLPTKSGSPSHTVTVPPYCIEPPAREHETYTEGSPLIFRLLLFAHAIAYLPYFIHAFSLMGERGLGSCSRQYTSHQHSQKIQHKKFGTFRIKDVLCDTVSIFDAEHSRLSSFPVHTLTPPQWQPSQQKCHTSQCHTKECHMHLETPLRFKQHNHFADTLSFERLILLCIRRATILWALEGHEYSLKNFAQCMDCAKSITCTQHTLRWHDWTRYSGKQKSAMQFGGIVGTATYQGSSHCLRDFLPFLDFARHAHLGKQTSFGLGKLIYTVTA